MSTSSDPDRLDRLERELAVRRLLDRYAGACDADDPDLVASLFEPGGQLLVRDEVRTGSEICDYYATRLDRPTLHFVTGTVMEERADGNLAVSSGFLAIEMRGASSTALAGRYDDLVEVVDGSARFVSRRITVTGRATTATAFG